MHLQNPATALKVLLNGNIQAESDIKVLFKILPSASADDFDDLGYEFFNTTGGPDNAVNVSLTPGDFQEYEYTGGVKDDGIGEQFRRVYSVCNQDCINLNKRCTST